MFERYRDIIPDFDNFLLALNRPHPSHLRVNTLKTDSVTLKKRLERYGGRLTTLRDENAFAFEGLSKPGATIEYFLGHYHLQGLSSMLSVDVLSPQKDETVLDMCASPGSKTTQIAQIMDNTGTIIANDPAGRRLGILKFHIERLGVLNCVVTNYFGQNFPIKDGNGGPLHIDRALVDAPCTGEGRYRKPDCPYSDEEIENHYSARAVAKLSKVQRAVILKGFDLLKHGGVMVYSTCTYSPEENEEVVEYLLKNRRGAYLEDITLRGLKTAEGITAFRGKGFTGDMKKAVRIYPHFIDSWGFFIALIRKGPQ